MSSPLTATLVDPTGVAPNLRLVWDDDQKRYYLMSDHDGAHHKVLSIHSGGDGKWYFRTQPTNSSAPFEMDASFYAQAYPG